MVISAAHRDAARAGTQRSRTADSLLPPASSTFLSVLELLAKRTTTRTGVSGSSLPAEAVVDLARLVVRTETPRVAALGGWGQRTHRDRLALRVPTGRVAAPGFDAGIACALDLIPRSRQRLSARLHAAYSEAAITQVREEVANLSPDSESCWWLAACNLCVDSLVDLSTFVRQLVSFHALTGDDAKRLLSAQCQLAVMHAGFEVTDGVAVSVAPGGMQGAYIFGHDLAVSHDTSRGIWFIGTFRPSLGLEDFPWRDLGDPSAADPEQRMGRSGPVHGSRQFVKCCDVEELEGALAAAASSVHGS